MEIAINAKPAANIISTSKFGFSSDSGRGKSIKDIAEKLSIIVAITKNVTAGKIFISTHLRYVFDLIP